MLTDIEKNSIQGLFNKFVLRVGPDDTVRIIKLLNLMLKGPLSEENRAKMVFSKNPELNALYLFLYPTPEDPNANRVEFSAHVRTLLTQQVAKFKSLRMIPHSNLVGMESDGFFGYCYHLAEIAPEACAQLLRIRHYTKALNDILTAIIIKNNPDVAALLRNSYNFTNVSLHTIHTQLSDADANKKNIIDVTAYLRSFMTKDAGGFAIPLPQYMHNDSKYLALACGIMAERDPQTCLRWLKMPSVVEKLNDDFLALIIKDRPELAKALIEESTQETELGNLVGKMTLFVAACTIANATATPQTMMLSPTQWESLGSSLRQMFLLAAPEYVSPARRSYIYDFDPALSLTIPSLRKMSQKQLITYCLHLNHFREFAILPIFLDDELRRTLGVYLQIKLLHELPELARLLASTGVDILLKLDGKVLFAFCEATIATQPNISMFVLTTVLRHNLSIEEQFMLVHKNIPLMTALLDQGLIRPLQAPPLKTTTTLAFDDPVMVELRNQYSPLLSELQADKKLEALKNEKPGDPGPRLAAHNLFTSGSPEKKRKSTQSHDFRPNPNAGASSPCL